MCKEIFFSEESYIVTGNHPEILAGKYLETVTAAAHYFMAGKQLEAAMGLDVR